MELLRFDSLLHLPKEYLINKHHVESLKYTQQKKNAPKSITSRLLPDQNSDSGIGPTKLLLSKAYKETL